MRQRAFTLAELLVVLGILAMIAAILCPVFASARERGRRAACQSNLRQLAAATQMYVRDNDGAYPLWSDWAAGVFPYVKDAEVYRCPSLPVDSPETIGLPSGVKPVDYGYDFARLNVLPPRHTKGHAGGIQEGAISNPSLTWLDGDLSWILRDGTKHDGDTRHGGGGNNSFVDGHVKWLTPGGIGEIARALGPLPPPFQRAGGVQQRKGGHVLCRLPNSTSRSTCPIWTAQ